jgi:hypothetical protein
MQKQDYETDDEYKQQLKDLTQMIEQHAEYSRILPTLPPKDRAEAADVLQKLGDAIETFEQKLADKYEIIKNHKKNELFLLLPNTKAIRIFLRNLRRKLQGKWLPKLKKNFTIALPYANLTTCKIF